MGDSEASKEANRPGSRGSDHQGSSGSRKTHACVCETIEARIIELVQALGVKTEE